MNSERLLTAFEHCNRAGGFARDWGKWKLTHTEMLARGILEGLTTMRKDFNEAAGEKCIELGGEPGLDSKEPNLYDAVVHLATLSDIIVTALRKSAELPWETAKPIRIGDGPMWTSSAFLAPSGERLRKVALVSGWSDDRHYAECRAWSSLGEVCAYGLPMDIAVIILGQYRDGKRRGYWSHGLLHPIAKKVRFRKRQDKGRPFKESWQEIWREDRDEIPTADWLAAMHADGVLEDVCFRIDLPVPAPEARQRILDLAARKLDAIEDMKVLPEQNLSTCDVPPCQFRNPCHAQTTPSGKFGFVRVDQLISW